LQQIEIEKQRLELEKKSKNAAESKASLGPETTSTDNSI
jgi:hypothetical protein